MKPAPCRDCAESGMCDLEAEKSRLAFFAGDDEPIVCALHVERTWHGLEGVTE